MIAAIIGVALTVVAADLTRRREDARERDTLDGRARRAQLLMARELVLPVEILRGVRSFFHASQGAVSRAQFRRFVASALRRYPSLYAVQWAPLVHAGERAAYVSRARAEGLPRFEFTEEAGLQSVRPRAEADSYLPLYYAEPENDALGFDLLSEPHRRTSVETARDGGDVVGSRRFRLVEDPEGVYSVAAYLAVYQGGHVPPSEAERRTQLAGMAIQVFRVGPLIEDALARVRTEGIDVAVIDVDEAGEEEVVHELSPGAAARIATARGGVQASEPVPFAERRWEIRFHAPRGFAGTRTAGFVLGGGLLATLILTLLAFLLARTRELSVVASRARRLGQYVIERKIGEGGMGVVFAATHAMLRRVAAVKLVSRATPTTLARFEREVRAASKLRHPNAVQIWDYGRTREGVFYYAMEYVDGVDLETLVRTDGPMHPGRAVGILVQVAGALREAHQANLVHRDIKPANIMIAEIGGVPDFAKVLDFGLAKDLDDHGPRTLVTEGKVVGTPLFVSPEQIDAPSDVDGRADLWSLGAVAYYLLCGHPPYEGTTVGEVVQARFDGAPLLPSVKRGSPVPEALEQLVMELLSRDPGRRPADADALIRRLEALEGLPPWKTSDASRWWRERGAALRAAARTQHQDIDRSIGERIAVQ